MDHVNTDKAVVVAEVYSRALRADDGGWIASYILVDDLTEDEGNRAMHFFSSQASLLVDVSRLVEDCGAEFPALVAIRLAVDTAGYMATADTYDCLRMLPDDTVISRNGWDIFCAREALLRGEPVDDAEALTNFDYRALRRKVYANRALIKEDRSPWLIDEYKQLRTMTEHKPEGSETFIAMADDMEAALKGDVEIGDSFSVVIPTKIERSVPDGVFVDWIPQTGREIVVAHGLDAMQAARVLTIVEKNPSGFITTSALLSSADTRETTGLPFIVPDAGLNWISTDFSGRRSAAGYERLQNEINTARNVVEAEVYQLPGRSSQR